MCFEKISSFFLGGEQKYKKKQQTMNGYVEKLKSKSNKLFLSENKPPFLLAIQRNFFFAKLL